MICTSIFTPHVLVGLFRFAIIGPGNEGRSCSGKDGNVC